MKIANIFLLDRPSRGGLSFIRTYTIVQATSIDKWTRKLRPRNCRGVAGCDRSESRPRQEIRFRTHALRLRRARIHLDFKRRPEDDARIHRREPTGSHLGRAARMNARTPHRVALLLVLTWTGSSLIRTQTSRSRKSLNGLRLYAHSRKFDWRCGRGGAFQQKESEIGGQGLRTQPPNHRSDLATMIRGVVGQMLHEVR